MPDKVNMPCRATMCATCPFRPGSPYRYLVEELTNAAAREGRICHSTGSDNAINRRTGLPPHLCRGARDFQLELMTAAGVIAEPTDEAWNAARVKYGMDPIAVADPVKVKR